MRDGTLSPALRAGMILAALLTPFGSTSIAVALPGIGREMGAGRADLNLWLVITYLLVAIAGQGPGGRLGDRITHERALMTGLGLHAIGALLGWTAVGLAGLAAARILAAAGGAIVVPAAMALVRTGVPEARRARTFGLLGGALGLAAAIGPPAGARLVEAFGWRSLFAFNMPWIAAAALLVARKALQARRRERSASKSRRADLVGAFLLAAGLAPIVVAITPASGHGVAVAGRSGAAAALGFGAGAIAAVLAGTVLLGLFVAWERRTAQPVFDFDLFRRPAFTAGSGVIALQNLALYGILFLLPASAAAAATKAAGSGARGAETLLFAMLGGLVIGPPIGGRLVEREGARMTALCGSFLTIVGLLIARRLEGGALPEVLAGLFLVGLGLGIASAPAQASAMDAAAAGSAGTAAGTLSTMRYLGGLAGIAIINAVPGAPALQHAWLAATGTAALLSLRLPGRAG
jgi:MFS family permease